MVLDEEGGTDFFRLVEEFGLRSRLEDVLNGKGEKGEEKEADDEDEEVSDDAEDDDSRSINSTNESR